MILFRSSIRGGAVALIVGLALAARACLAYPGHPAAQAITRKLGYGTGG
ncbi:hypothetical protein [Rhodovulum adriaticum]|uniref:Uncharacterized protein n=1 Tax=Rhodovulum adriaticum TaxID=35804 RepID=A0A4R2NVB5_RHOAD|nr:hypothetical protein [Rhodovulum adriaticum]TCP25345.1 hypothetical protein EV656_10394 [Rhodovulum adriaticum]